MLIPLTRKTFESLVPAVATGPQYNFYWGKPPDFLRRLLISVVAVFAVVIFGFFIPHDFEYLRLVVGLVGGVYWLWAPVLGASLRNIDCRKYQYSGFWQGRVIDVYLSDELIGNEETVNSRGDLVIVENRERRLNLEVGDETGFSTRLQVPLKRSHQAIAIGDAAQMLVLSNRGDLGRIARTTDIYLPDHNLWVSDYPYLQREAFIEVSRRLEARLAEDPEASERSSSRRKPHQRDRPVNRSRASESPRSKRTAAAQRARDRDNFPDDDPFDDDPNYAAENRRRPPSRRPTRRQTSPSDW